MTSEITMEMMSDQELTRREFLHFVADVATGAAGVVGLGIGARWINPPGELSSPEPVPTPGTPIPNSTPKPEEAPEDQLDRMVEEMERSNKLVYGLKGLNRGELQDFRATLGWDGTTSDAAKQNLVEGYRTYRDLLTQRTNEVNELLGEQFGGLATQQRGDAIRVFRELKFAKEFFDQKVQAQAVASGLTGNDIELAEARKWQWLRLRQTEYEAKGQVTADAQATGKEPIWQKVFNIYRIADLPPSSNARIIPPTPDQEVDVADMSTGVAEVQRVEDSREIGSGLGISNILVNYTTGDFSSTPTAGENKLITKQQSDINNDGFEIAAESCESGKIIETRGVSNNSDDRLGTTTQVHLTNRQTRDGGIASFGSVGADGGWTARVVKKTGTGSREFIYLREPNETNAFDNTGIEVNYNGRPCLANILCVVYDGTDGKEYSKVKGVVFDPSADSSQPVMTQNIHEAGLGGFADFTQSGQFSAYGGEDLGTWLLADENGYKHMAALWRNNQFVVAIGTLNDPAHNANQFGRTIGYEGGKHKTSYAFYQAGIKGMTHDIEFKDVNGRPQVVHHNNTQQVISLISSEDLGNDDISRDIVAGRIASLTRMATDGSLIAAEVPIFVDNTATIRATLHNTSGTELVNRQFGGGGYHRVIGDTALTEVVFSDIQGNQRLVDAMLIRNFLIPLWLLCHRMA